MPQSALSHFPVIFMVTVISRPLAVLVDVTDAANAAGDCASVRDSDLEGRAPVQIIVFSRSLAVHQTRVRRARIQSIGISPWGLLCQ